MKRWCLVDSGFHSGAFNMAYDETLLRRAQQDIAFVPTLRVYGFRRPTITYGYSQRIAKHWLEDPFYESSRRITGGGLVFHGKDLTYSFVGSTRVDPSFQSLSSSYRVFHEVIQEAFRRIHIVVDFFPGVSAKKTLKNFCFLSPVRNDLLFQGKKIAGAAEKRGGNVFLHQGTVNLRVFLKEEDEYLPLFERLKSALLHTFREYFKVGFIVKSIHHQVKKGWGDRLWDPKDVLTTGV